MQSTVTFSVSIIPMKALWYRWRTTVWRPARSQETVDLIVGQVCNLPNAPMKKMRRLNLAKTGRLQTGATSVPRGEAMTIAEPESPHPHRRLNRLRHEVPIQELPVV